MIDKIKNFFFKKPVAKKTAVIQVAKTTNIYEINWNSQTDALGQVWIEFRKGLWVKKHRYYQHLDFLRRTT